MYLPSRTIVSFTAIPWSYVSVRNCCTVDLYAPTVASPSCQAGPALLILFYLRAPLNINVVFSLNYNLTGLPTPSAFVPASLFLSPPLSLCISLHHSWLSLSTPKVNFWWYQMWWVVGSHSSLSRFYDSNPATWAKSPPLFCLVDGIWKHLVSQRREVESKPEI